MQTVPFLTKFKIKRISDPLMESVELKYDEKLEHNLITNNRLEFLLGSTRTTVLPEKPDVYEDLEYIAKLNDYYSSNTYTNVKSEKPDEIEDQYLLALSGTETFTRVMSESPDEDRISN